MESEFRIEVRTQGARAVIALSGELDLASSPELEEELDRVFESGAEAVAIDLRQLEFMDSTGLSVLVQAHHRASESQRRLCVVKGPPQVQRLLTLTRVGERMCLIDSPDELLDGS